MAVELDYPKKVQKIAAELLEIIEKYYPGVTKGTYNSCGIPCDEGSPAQLRAEACIYIELLKAGVNFNE